MIEKLRNVSGPRWFASDSSLLVLINTLLARVATVSIKKLAA